MAQRADSFSEPDDWSTASPDLPALDLTAPLPQATLTLESRIACLRLIRTDGIGPVSFRVLINRYGGAEAAIEALPALARETGRKRLPKVPDRASAERELEAADKLGLMPIFTIEPGYPPLLAHVPPAPPPLLYFKGRIESLSRPMVAIVGSRDASAAGQRLTRQFAAELGQAGFTIVSGLARGIDRVAHETALETGTVAVLAGGLDTIYPPEHAGLAQAIATSGCLVSEMPPGFEPRAQDFPRRNRIISGMARAVLIVEAASRSGTLTTARFATEQGREVFAIPGHPLDPRAEGVNALIKQGATFTTTPSDILATLGTFDKPLPFAPSTPDRRDHGPATRTVPAIPPSAMVPVLKGADILAVLAVLGPQPTTADEVGRATGLTARKVAAALTDLDLAGRLERHGHGLVSRREGRQE